MIAAHDSLIPTHAQDFCFARRELAKQFGVRDIHFVPCREGVLEYGCVCVYVCVCARACVLVCVYAFMCVCVCVCM